jgi:hypothetical protein
MDRHRWRTLAGPAGLRGAGGRRAIVCRQSVDDGPRGVAGAVGGGGAGAGASQPRGQVPARPDPHRDRLVGVVGGAPGRGRPARPGRLARTPHHAAGRSGGDEAGAVAAAPAVVLAQRSARLRAPARHGARPAPGHAQRGGGVGRPAGARLDCLPPSPAVRHVRRHGPPARGRERDRRRARRWLVARAARVQAGGRSMHVRRGGRAHRAARGPPRRWVDDDRGDGRRMAGVDRRGPIGGPVRRLPDRPASAPARLGHGRLRRPRLGAGASP